MARLLKRRIAPIGPGKFNAMYGRHVKFRRVGISARAPIRRRRYHVRRTEVVQGGLKIAEK
jgi:hypothetical protein